MLFQHSPDFEDESQKRFDLQVCDLLAQFLPIRFRVVAHKALLLASERKCYKPGTAFQIGNCPNLLPTLLSIFRFWD
jgi:hypothetical protein